MESESHTPTLTHLDPVPSLSQCTPVSPTLCVQRKELLGGASVAMLQRQYQKESDVVEGAQAITKGLTTAIRELEQTLAQQEDTKELLGRCRVLAYGLGTPMGWQLQGDAAAWAGVEAAVRLGAGAAV